MTKPITVNESTIFTTPESWGEVMHLSEGDVNDAIKSLVEAIGLCSDADWIPEIEECTKWDFEEYVDGNAIYSTYPSEYKVRKYAIFSQGEYGFEISDTYDSIGDVVEFEI